MARGGSCGAALAAMEAVQPKRAWGAAGAICAHTALAATLTRRIRPHTPAQCAGRAPGPKLENIFNKTMRRFFSYLGAETEKTFCRPTRDSVFKHVLSDEATRKSFISSLSPFKNVVSSTLMSTELRPLAVDQNLLNFLKKSEFQTFVKNEKHLELSSALFGSLSKQEQDTAKILDSIPFLRAALESKPEASKEELKALRKEYGTLSMCKEFFAALRNKFELILLALLDEKKGVCDIVSRLDTGDIVLLEAQVVKTDCLDRSGICCFLVFQPNQRRAGMVYTQERHQCDFVIA